MQGQCLTLEPRVSIFAGAARDLVRPDEVRHLIKRVEDVTPDEVGRWLARERKERRLRYIPDTSDGRDHWCSPAATLRRGGGDCEDLAIVAVSLLLVRQPAWVCIGWRLHSSGRRESHAWVEGVGPGELGDVGFFMEATTGKVQPSRPFNYELVRALR